MAIVNWRGDAIVAAQEQAFEETNHALVSLFAREITEYKWQWPRVTERRRGRRRIGTPRDIVDRGELRNSYQGPEFRREQHMLVAEHIWDAPHALPVHEGATMRNGTELPARPWTLKPVSEANAVFERLARRRLAEV